MASIQRRSTWKVMRSVSWVLSLAWVRMALRSCHQATSSSRTGIRPITTSLYTEGVLSVDTSTDEGVSIRFLRGVAISLTPEQECIHDVHLRTRKYTIGVHRCARVVRSGYRFLKRSSRSRRRISVSMLLSFIACSFLALGAHSWRPTLCRRAAAAPVGLLAPLAPALSSLVGTVPALALGARLQRPRLRARRRLSWCR